MPLWSAEAHRLQPRLQLQPQWTACDQARYQLHKQTSQSETQSNARQITGCQKREEKRFDFDVYERTRTTLGRSEDEANGLEGGAAGGAGAAVRVEPGGEAGEEVQGRDGAHAPPER